MAAVGLLWLAVFGVALVVVLAEALNTLVKQRFRRLRVSRPGKPE
jgi:peptidoglycan/LPS O-acetylase OafA/YrhL